ncbi:UNVERIFIED_CONTAM: hypothetical protein Sindi_1661400, partial [Sesamum indicum]
ISGVFYGFTSHSNLGYGCGVDVDQVEWKALRQRIISGTPSVLGLPRMARAEPMDLLAH